MVRHGLIFYFSLVILEGVFRKWLLPDLNQYIYVAKDAVLAFICFRLILSLGYVPSPPWLRRTTVGQLFVAFAIYSFAQGFNFNLPSIKLGIWGIRTYVLPMSLVYLVPLGFPDPRMNERYFRYYLLLGYPNRPVVYGCNTVCRRRIFSTSMRTPANLGRMWPLLSTLCALPARSRIFPD